VSDGLALAQREPESLEGLRVRDSESAATSQRFRVGGGQREREREREIERYGSDQRAGDASERRQGGERGAGVMDGCWTDSDGTGIYTYNTHTYIYIYTYNTHTHTHTHTLGWDGRLQRLG
jgi:hypothetical protein